ncbi:hypothetical protein BDP81DRAFT_329569 [Colletotrichum phormii]|uniref:Uncharacterized protein n=1 Tax=Colletotrichum phormii TaxID=359342 RepID=A0AAI9ZHR4_9PEZI|nr:uncharacterized protein BDP81DRAFT_329569 [Colletotrichum phormii]KAK1624807.1 hypothetical protein BDP81DRAFT_329569 [Colletotrichum phormii]
MAQREQASNERTDSASESEDVIAVANPTADVPVFKCDYCGSTFGRQEHLTRHKRSHTREKPFSCSACGKSFSRLDVLTRHAASHDEVASESRRPVASSRACQACAVSHSRCSKGSPCRHCTGKGFECKYPVARRRATRSAFRSPDESAAPEEGHESHQGHMDYSDPVQVPQPSGMTEMPFPTPDHAPERRAVETSWPLSMNPMDNFIHNEEFPEQSAGISAINWLSPQYYADFDWGIMSSTVMNAYEAVRQGPWLNLLNSQPVQTPNAALPPASVQRFNPPGTTPRSRPNGSTTGSIESSSTAATYYVDGAPSRAPFKGRPSQRSLVLDNSVRPDDDTPTPSTAAPDTSRDADEGTGLDLSVQAYDNLLHHISVEPFLRDRSATPLPSLAHARVYFRLYFQHFHPAYTLPQKSTDFYHEPASWPLLLAVCAVGSVYSRGETNLRFRDLFLQLLESAVRFYISTGALDDVLGSSQVSLASPAEDSIGLVIAQTSILWLIQNLHNGVSGDSYDLSFLVRHFLINACRKMDLLGKRENLTQVEHQADGSDVLRRWVGSESRLRTGLMIWVLDAVVFLERGQDVLLKLGDAKGHMPCLDSIWDQPTAKKLGQQHSHIDNHLLTIPEAMELLYMEKRLPPNLGDFSTMVLTYAIIRRTKEALYHNQIRLNSWTPTADVQKCGPGDTIEETWPPSLPILSRWRNSACDSLDLFHWNANAIIAKAGGWEHPVILHLHLSRLVLLAPISHLQTLAAAASARASSRNVDNSKVEKARSLVAQWALRDQYKARLSVVHASAMLWHIRRYSVDNFLESFGIFTATLVVWAYSTMMLFMRRHQNSGSHLTNGGSGQQGSPMEAVAEVEEDPEPSFLHLDRPCDDEMVQTYVRLGHKMAGHMAKVGNICNDGAPRKILKEGIEMLKGRPEQNGDPANSVGSGGIGENVRGHSVWGVERTYADLLDSLIQSTSD